MTSQIATLLSVGFIAILPSFIWLFFYLKEDIHPEPKSWIWVVFILGIAIAPFVLFLETLLRNFITLTDLGAPETLLVIVLVAPLIEEVAKYGIVHLALNKNLILDEPVDGMIYLIVAALGFAGIENVFAVFNYASLAPENFLAQSIYLTALRFVSAVALHAFASAIAGYFFAKYYFAPKRHVWHILQGLFYAIALHGIYNLLIIRMQNGYPNARLMVGLFLGGAATFVLWLFHDLKNKEANETLITFKENNI